MVTGYQYIAMSEGTSDDAVVIEVRVTSGRQRCALLVLARQVARGRGSEQQSADIPHDPVPVSADLA